MPIIISGSQGTLLQVDATSGSVPSANAPILYVTGGAVGRIGIGTATPISALEIEDGLTTGGAVLTLGTKEPTVVAADVLGRINFYAPLDTGTDSDEIGASIAAIAQATFSDSVNSTALHFQTGKSEVATTKMVIDEDGRVGIGTTAPARALEIEDPTSAAFQLTALNARGADLDNTYSFISDSYGFSIFDTTTGGTPGYRFNIADGGGTTTRGYVGIGDGAGVGGSTFPTAQLHVSSSNGGATFRVDAAFANPALFITGSGQVGIGTISPASLLHVSGADGALFQIDALSGSVPSANTPILFVTGGAVGRIGIGTADPGASLDIVGDTSSDQLRVGFGGTNYYKIGRNGDNGFLDFTGMQAGNTGYAFKNDDGTTDLTILDSGEVQVGTNTAGNDVRFFSTTTNEGVHYDASEDELGLLLTTKLKFHDIGGGEEIYASANGHLEVNAGTTLDITAPTVDINASTAVTIDGPSVTFADNTSQKPLVIIKNTTNDAEAARLRFVKDKGAAGAANDVAGIIEFYADDASQHNIAFASITGSVKVHTNGQEGGKLTLGVASHDGEIATGLTIEDGAAEDQVLVSVGAATPTSIFHTSGSHAGGVAVCTANATLDATHFVVVFQGTAGVTGTLPAVATCPGRIYHIFNKLDDGGGNQPNPLIVKGNASENIEHANTLDLDMDVGNSSVSIVNLGSAWSILGLYSQSEEGGG